MVQPHAREPSSQQDQAVSKASRTARTSRLCSSRSWRRLIVIEWAVEVLGRGICSDTTRPFLIRKPTKCTGLVDENLGSRSSCASKPPATLSTGIGPEWSIGSPGRLVVEVVFGSISNKKKATNWRYAEVTHAPESECYVKETLHRARAVRRQNQAGRHSSHGHGYSGYNCG